LGGKGEQFKEEKMKIKLLKIEWSMSAKAWIKNRSMEVSGEDQEGAKLRVATQVIKRMKSSTKQKKVRNLRNERSIKQLLVPGTKYARMKSMSGGKGRMGALPGENKNSS